MCCGRSVKAAASQHYVSPSINTETSMGPKKAAAPAKKVKEYPIPKRPGAYYGNPISRKSVEKPLKLTYPFIEKSQDQNEALKALDASPEVIDLRDV